MKYASTLVMTLVFLCACVAEDESNRAVGELASDRIELTAEFAEPIVEIAVAEGDSVVAGEVLMRLDDTRAKARLAQTIAAENEVRARLQELVRGPRSEQISAARANVEGAQKDLNFKTSELLRIREVHERGLMSEDALDGASAALDAAKALMKLRTAELQERLSGTTVEELAQVEQAVLQAVAVREAAEVDLERHTQRAPVNGIVDSRLFELGERPGVGQPTVVMLGGTQPYARVYVTEASRIKIRPGSRASIYVDGMNTALTGRVRWIATEPAFTPYFALTERDRGRLSFVAKIDIVGEHDRLADGVPVEVELFPGESD